MALQPLVSIIIPTYNRAHLIGETLDSVLAQTYQNWECIVVDDGSTDGTADLLKSYIAKDARFQYHKLPDAHLPGGNGARNYGFELSQGDYIQWLDSDDLLSSDKILNQISRLTKDSSYTLLTCRWARFAFTDKIRIKEHDLYYKDYSQPLKLLEDLGLGTGLFPSHVYLVDRTILKKSGLWDEDLFINQDGEFFCRVILSSKEVLFSEHGIAMYRYQTKENTSITNTYIKSKERIRSWKMIQKHIADSDSSYVNRGKRSCFKKIKRRYPFLIIKNVLFFKKEIKDYFG